MGCGRIASDFVNALKSADNFELAACAARTTESATSFAETHGVSAAYGSYAELAQSEILQHFISWMIANVCLAQMKASI